MQKAAEPLSSLRVSLLALAGALSSIPLSCEELLTGSVVGLLMTMITGTPSAHGMTSGSHLYALRRPMLGQGKHRTHTVGKHTPKLTDTPGTTGTVTIPYRPGEMHMHGQPTAWTEITQHQCQCPRLHLLDQTADPCKGPKPLCTPMHAQTAGTQTDTHTDMIQKVIEGLTEHHCALMIFWGLGGHTLVSRASMIHTQNQSMSTLQVKHQGMQRQTVAIGNPHCAPGVTEGHRIKPLLLIIIQPNTQRPDMQMTMWQMACGMTDGTAQVMKMRTLRCRHLALHQATQTQSSPWLQTHAGTDIIGVMCHSHTCISKLQMQHCGTDAQIRKLLQLLLQSTWTAVWTT